MVTLNSLNEWFYNLGEREQLNVLAMNCCYTVKEAKRESKKKLIQVIFSNIKEEKKTYIEEIRKDWENETNQSKLEHYWWYSGETSDNYMDLLDKNDYENYILFLDKIDFVRVVGLENKLASIYTIEHIMKFWNDLTEKEKAERILQL